MSNTQIFTYENKLLALMSLTFGLVFVDRMAVTFLSPYLVRDLHLNNAQLGMLASGLGLTWAFSGYFSTAWAEANDRKKQVFIWSVVLFSICSIGSGLATSFAVLLVTRLLMGLFEGPALPLIQSFVARESSPNRLGFNMGFLQSFGSTLFGFLLAPVLLVVLAEKFGWRSTFFIVGIPGLIVALINWKFIRKSTAERSGQAHERSLTFNELWQYKNIRIGVLLSCCLMTWLQCSIIFLPKYFMEKQQLAEGDIGPILGLMGLSSLISGILIPTLSDRFGRKPLVTLCALLGIFYPLAILLLPHSGAQLPLMFITYFMFGSLPIVLSAIPSETVPQHSTGKAIGMLVAAGEIAGGVVMPLLAGIAADRYGIGFPFWIAAGAAMLAAVLSFFLIETKKS